MPSLTLLTVIVYSHIVPQAVTLSWSMALFSCIESDDFLCKQFLLVKVNTSSFLWRLHRFYGYENSLKKLVFHKPRLLLSLSTIAAQKLSPRILASIPRPDTSQFVFIPSDVTSRTIGSLSFTSTPSISWPILTIRHYHFRSTSVTPRSFSMSDTRHTLHSRVKFYAHISKFLILFLLPLIIFSIQIQAPFITVCQLIVVLFPFKIQWYHITSMSKSWGLITLLIYSTYLLPDEIPMKYT